MRRMARRLGVAAASCGLVLIALSGCASSSPVPAKTANSPAPTTSSPSSTSTASSSPSASSSSEAATDISSDAAEFRTTARLGSPVMSPRGIEVTVSKPQEYTPQDKSKVLHGTTPLKLTVSVRNSSTAPYPLLLKASMTSADKAAPQLSGPKVAKQAETLPTLAPGSIWSTELGFIATDPNNLSLKVELYNSGQPIYITYVTTVPSDGEPSESPTKQ